MTIQFFVVKIYFKIIISFLVFVIVSALNDGNYVMLFFSKLHSNNKSDDRGMCSAEKLRYPGLGRVPEGSAGAGSARWSRETPWRGNDMKLDFRPDHGGACRTGQLTWTLVLRRVSGWQGLLHWVSVVLHGSVSRCYRELASRCAPPPLLSSSSSAAV